MKQFSKSFLFVALLILALASDSSQAFAKSSPKVKNVIFLIGDGMGLAHISATAVNGNYAPLAMERAHYVGFAKTYSSNSRVTDSAASGTALATGTKTYNGAIGVDADKKPVVSILEKAEANGLATGLVATYAVTNATPASFIAHVESRKEEEKIADDFLKTDIDLFIGGGKKFFTQRADKRDLTTELQDKGYTMAYTLDDVVSFNGTKLAALLADVALPKMSDGRGDYLPKATAKALEILKRNSRKGFFVMIEGSMIDGGGHTNDIEMVIDELTDFDKAVKVAFDFSDANPGTLVVVTADHETGGLTLPNGKSKAAVTDQGINYSFSTKGHTGIYVPVFAYGTGAREFGKVLENTDIPKIMERLLRLK